MATVSEARELIPELCRQLYAGGHVSGTGGGMAIRVGDKHVVAPSGVQKERMRPTDLFVLDAAGNVLEEPEARPPPYKPPKLSECYPLFQQAFNLRGAGAVLHSHSTSAVLATLLSADAMEFRVTNLEMIKGIQGHGYYDTCVVPIIENTARECELTDSLREAILKYPKTSAVLVRRHGVYVWGKDWIHAKTQAECYDYLFKMAVEMRSLGLDASQPPAGAANGARPAKRQRTEPTAEAPRRAVVLDIEGTVVPLAFVKKTLFPYAQDHLLEFLQANVQSPEVIRCLEELYGMAKSLPNIPGAGPDISYQWAQHAKGEPSRSAAALPAAAVFIRGLMDKDSKASPLKVLQGLIWQGGYASGELKAALFPDVLPALEQWAAAGVKVYIFSSGSRDAQARLFQHTTQGDVRHLLSGFFDTSSGPKVQAASYQQIALSLGMDASQISFATDIASEADAAQEAGWKPVLVSRPGNAELPSQLQHAVIHSLADMPAGEPEVKAKRAKANGYANGHAH